MADYLCWLLCICFIASLESQKVYITSNSKHETISCIMNKTLLTPCYTLSQIIKNEVLVINESIRIELNFLPGTHVMPENGVLNAADFDEVTFKSWNEILDAEIDCQPGSEHIIFNNTGELRIYFMHFLSCRLSCYYPMESVYIISSVFEGSRDYTMNVSLNTQVPVTISNSTFLQSHGAVALRTYDPFTDEETCHVLVENSTFQDNRHNALDVIRTALTVRFSDFINNSAMEGGGIRAQDSILALHYTTFTNNVALKRGGAILLDHSSVKAFDCNFINNTADIGGAITNTANDGNVDFYRTMFNYNQANKKGGALHFYRVTTAIEDCHFQRNFAMSGGALSIEGADCQLTNTSFVSNEARGNGGAVYHASDAYECFTSYICELQVESSMFRNNVAMSGGAIFVNKSSMTFIMTTLFKENRATKHGGALALFASIVNCNINTTLTFYQNVADSKGGAMFIDDNCEQTPNNYRCFLRIEHSLNLTFESNMANKGKDVYGGLLDKCKIGERPGIQFFSQYATDSQAIMSDPIRACSCDSDYKPNCKNRELTFEVTPGDYIEVDIAIVDQNMNPRSSTIVAEYSGTAVLGQGERTQNTSDSCKKLIHHVFSKSSSENLILRPKIHCRSPNFSNVAVHIIVVPCPRGFEERNDTCSCERRITDFTKSCNVRTDSVERMEYCNVRTDSFKRIKSVWLSYDKQYLKVNKYCPLNYCNLTQKIISLKIPDKQCANHRSGVLCGACQQNYSIALGTSKCIRCTSKYAFFWLIPVFAVAGIALVAFLLTCNMNISHGTINGLIFYANVVSISGLTSFQNCSNHPILTVFIAWLNLDFGFETCFYPGMDTYQKTWLQFAFPLYIWLLVGGIILASHYSARAMKVFGRSNIAMLATLFLLSYTKLLKVIVTTVTFTEVLHGKAKNISDQLVPYNVWLYDGNIEYLKERHIPLFFVSLVMLLFLFLPFTLLLTIGQFVHLIPRRRNCILKIIHSTALHSILDAYHAPYTKRHRYWTGLLLLSRCALILALFSSYKESNFLAVAHVNILVLIAILTLKATCAVKVYKNTFKAILEVSFLVNLLILSYFLKSSDDSDTNACRYISASISISLVTFIGILCYHAYLQIRKTVVVIDLKKKITLAKKPTKQLKNNATSEHPAPTCTRVELRESLLATSITDY